MLWYFKNLCIALDQLVNAILGGWADETLSSRTWRLSETSFRWELLRILIDTMFFYQPFHCEKSYEWEQDRMDLPPALRNEKKNEIKRPEGTYISETLKNTVRCIHGDRCACCGAIETKGHPCKECGNEITFHIDHIVPQIEGGLTELSNLQLLCPLCNLSKGKGNKCLKHTGRRYKDGI